VVESLQDDQLSGREIAEQRCLPGAQNRVSSEPLNGLFRFLAYIDPYGRPLPLTGG
jgi:hypothetical protein